MLRFFIRRCLLAILALFCAAVFIFFAIEILPGDPAQVMLGVNASPESIAILRSQLGLDQPVLVRFSQWLMDLASINFGTSLIHGDRVADVLFERFSVSIPLAGLTIFISTSLAFLFGSLSALYRNKLPDYTISTISQIGIAIPGFWLGILLILIFSIELKWFPSGGFLGWSAGIILGLKSLVLPAVALALPQAAILGRIVRTSLIESMEQDFYRTAIAKGSSPLNALICHAFGNAIIPILAILGLQLAYLLAGVIVIENVFVLPGIGRLLIQATGQRDLIMIREIIILIVTMTICINFLIDIVYSFIDPRLKRSFNA